MNFAADEYEVLLCNKKGYGRIIEAPAQKSKREATQTEVSFKEHDAEDSKWHMNKTHYDTLWKDETNVSSTPHPLETDESGSDSADYDYETTDPQGANQTGWENDDVVEDPSHLDYMTWPKFLPGKLMSIIFSILFKNN